MAAPLLTTASSLTCPHGGTVSIVSANARVLAATPLALATDTFTIAGCPFQIPVGPAMVPHPCMSVQWIVTNLKTLVNGAPTLNAESSGLCLAADQVPQGPVSVVQTQPSATGS